LILGGTNRVIAVIDDPRQTQAATTTLQRAGIADRDVDVHVHGRRNQDAVAHILRAHGAHFINAYGQWTIEGIAA
jgi:hypothetical protein